MKISVILLGTSASLPTPRRSCPAVAIKFEGEIILFDCGEGTQIQMQKVGISPMKISKVFITHLHGDHFLGLAGIVQTLSLWNRTQPLEVYCPAPDKERLEAYLRIPRYVPTFEVRVVGLQEGEEVKAEGYTVKTARAFHPVPSLAYAFVENDRPGHLDIQKALSLGLKPGPLLSKLKEGESVGLPDGRVVKPSDVIGPPIKGRKIVYVGDTSPSAELVEFCRGADLLIHDSTFGEELTDKASQNYHSTVVQAAEVAKQAGVKKLVLFHISPRYEDDARLLEQARRVFLETILGADLMTIEL